MQLGLKYWWPKIKFFVREHPTLFSAGEKVYIPTSGVSLHFDAGLMITGTPETLEFNLNSDDILVLAVWDSQGEHIFRVPWERLVCFELWNKLNRDGKSPEELRKKFFLVKDTPKGKGNRRTRE